MLQYLVPCVLETFKETLQIGLFFVTDLFYCSRKTLPTMKSIVEGRETLILLVSAESKKHFIFSLING